MNLHWEVREWAVREPPLRFRSDPLRPDPLCSMRLTDLVSGPYVGRPLYDDRVGSGSRSMRPGELRIVPPTRTKPQPPPYLFIASRRHRRSRSACPSVGTWSELLRPGIVALNGSPPFIPLGTFHRGLVTLRYLTMIRFREPPKHDRSPQGPSVGPFARGPLEMSASNGCRAVREPPITNRPMHSANAPLDGSSIAASPTRPRRPVVT